MTGTGLSGKRKATLAVRAMNDRADADQGDVADPGAHALADPNRHEEIAEGDAPFGGRKSMQLRGREHASGSLR